MYITTKGIPTDLAPDLVRSARQLLQTEEEGNTVDVAHEREIFSFFLYIVGFPSCIMNRKQLEQI